MFDFNGDGIMDPGEEYLAFWIWEDLCLEDGEDLDALEDGEEV